MRCPDSLWCCLGVWVISLSPFSCPGTDRFPRAGRGVVLPPRGKCCTWRRQVALALVYRFSRATALRFSRRGGWAGPPWLVVWWASPCSVGVLLAVSCRGGEGPFSAGRGVDLHLATRAGEQRDLSACDFARLAGTVCFYKNPLVHMKAIMWTHRNIRLRNIQSTCIDRTYFRICRVSAQESGIL